MYSIAEDKKKNLFFGVFGSGFYQYNLQSRKLEHYESSKDEKGDLKCDELVNDWINYIFATVKDLFG